MLVKPYIQKSFNGAIWRMEIDEPCETLFIEVRNDEERKVYFSSIDLVSGKIHFENIVTAEPWLTGIETAYNGILLLHSYASATSPEHKGLTAIDALTGDTLWSNYNYSFDLLSSNGPVLFDQRIQPRKLFLADSKTGVTIRPYDRAVDGLLKNNIIVPQHVNAEVPVLNLGLPNPVANMAHYLEYNNLRIVSLHAPNGTMLSQELYIFDDTEKVYHDLLNTGIQKIQPEAFIMHKNRLIYIKDKTDLKVLTL